MIDYLKIRVFKFDSQKVRQSPVLQDQFTQLNLSSGETFENKVISFQYRQLKVKIKNGNQLEIAGSLHKYFTFDDEIDCGYNHGNFFYDDLEWSINDIGKVLHFCPKDAKIENLEFGINMQPDPSCANFHMHLVSHKNKSFSQFHTKNKRPFGKCCRHHQYDVKIYNKGLQYNLTNPEIRVEIKVHRMAYLNEILKPVKGFPESQVLVLSDLLDRDVLVFLKDRVLRVLTEVLFHYKLPKDQLSPSEREFLLKYNNPITWDNMDLGKDFKRNKKRRYNQLVRQYRKQLLNDVLVPLVEKKWAELMKSSASQDVTPSYSYTDYLVTLYDHSDSMGLTVTREIISIPSQHPP